MLCTIKLQHIHNRNLSAVFRQDFGVYNVGCLKTGSSRSTPTQAQRIIVILYRPLGIQAHGMIYSCWTSGLQRRGSWISARVGHSGDPYCRGSCHRRQTSQMLINATVNARISRLVVCGNVSTLQSNFKYIHIYVDTCISCNETTVSNRPSR